MILRYSHGLHQPQTPYKYTVKGSSTHYVDHNKKKTPKLRPVQPSHGHFNPSFGSSFLQSSGQEYSGQPFPHKPEQKSAHHHNNNKVNKENIHTAHVIICDVNIHLAVSFFYFISMFFILIPTYSRHSQNCLVHFLRSNS